MKIFKIFLVSLLLTGFALPALAEENATTTPPTTSTAASCMKAAAEKRDSALMTGWDSYTAKIKDGLQARLTSITAAWDKSTTKERKTAIKSAWSVFNKAQWQAKKDWQKIKNTSWSQYRTEIKKCGKIKSEDTSYSSADAGI
ncbi:MAG: hypothetical protein WCX71_01135 [Candidatus Buchananbacteria bacterium]